MSEEQVFSDPGPRPELAWLPLDHLVVDTRYQRNIEGGRNQAVIKKISTELRWRDFQPITVCRRPEGGGFAIIDGQHRVEAARRHPLVDAVPCWIVAADGLRDEAMSFVAINRDRSRVHPLSVFHAELAAGDPDALHVKAICDQVGITIPRRPFVLDRARPGEMMAVDTVRAALALYGDRPVLLALGALNEANAECGGALRKSPIKALIALCAAHRDLDRARLVRVLADIDMDDFELAARSWKASFGGNILGAMRAAFAAAYNKRLPPDRQLRESGHG